MVTKLKGMFSSKGTIWIHNYNGISIKIKTKATNAFSFWMVKWLTLSRQKWENSDINNSNPQPTLKADKDITFATFLHK